MSLRLRAAGRKGREVKKVRVRLRTLSLLLLPQSSSFAVVCLHFLVFYGKDSEVSPLKSKTQNKRQDNWAPLGGSWPTAGIGEKGKWRTSAGSLVYLVGRA